MLRIGFCIDSLEMGGAERLLVDIIESLYKTNEYEINLLTRLKSNSYFYNLIKDKVNYYFLLDERKKGIFKTLKESIIKRNNFKKFEKNIDIIIDFLNGDFYKYIKQIKNKEKIIWLNANYKELQKRQNVDIKIPLFDKVIVITDTSEEELKNSIHKNKIIKRIDNIVNYEEIDNKLKENMSIDIEQEYFLTVCRLNEEQKDVETLLRAYSKYDGREKLIIIGDGPDREKLKNMTVELKISERVIFLGNLKNPFPFMKKAKAFILSSKGEGFGLVLVEALYCGTKVISSNCPVGPSQILLNGEIGELFEVGNSEELFKKLKIIGIKEYDKTKIEESLKRYTKENFVKTFKKVVG